jgi:hypothetical protein
MSDEHVAPLAAGHLVDALAHVDVVVEGRTHQRVVVLGAEDAERKCVLREQVEVDRVVALQGLDDQRVALAADRADELDVDRAVRPAGRRDDRTRRRRWSARLSLLVP